MNLAALDWLETVSNKLQRGYTISIDYGYTSDRYYSYYSYYNPMRDRGTLQCYYHHSYHKNPYLNIGNQDLTSVC